MAARLATRARHAFAEHTADVRLELHAPVYADLFAEAGRALAELMLGEELASLAPGQAGDTEAIEVRASDPPGLLVEWLNELIVRSELDKRVFTHFEVERAGPTELVARVRGVEPGALKTAVKAATLHEVALERGAEGWRASVVLDV